MNPTFLNMTRRRFLASSAALATTLQLQRSAFAARMAPEEGVCRLIAQQEEGPYFVAGDLFRSSIVEGKPGVPLSLRILVLDARTCEPLSNAAVDIWHCDALGLYSGFTKQNPTGPGGPGGPGDPGGPPPGFDPQHPRNHPGPPEAMGPPPENHPTDNLTFLRGVQFTGTDGSVSFRTVFPGFYTGRTNHIHFKVRVGGQADGMTYEAGHTSHNGQIFFPEEVATELMQHEPYCLHKIHRTTQQEDHVFGGEEGELSIARLQPLHPGHYWEGIHADLVAVVDPNTTPAPPQHRGGPPAPAGPPPKVHS